MEGGFSKSETPYWSLVLLAWCSISLEMFNVIIIVVIIIIIIITIIIDRLCGLVVRVSGYRYRGSGFDLRRYQIF